MKKVSPIIQCSMPKRTVYLSSVGGVFINENECFCQGLFGLVETTNTMINCRLLLCYIERHKYAFLSLSPMTLHCVYLPLEYFQQNTLLPWAQFTETKSANGTVKFKIPYSTVFLKKWAIPGLSFLYFRLFNTVDSKQMFNINFCQ